MVKEQIEQLRDQRATWTPVTAKPAEGDMVVVDLAMADESGALPEGKEYRVVLGAGQAIAAIEEVIMELTPGETVEKPVRWPEDFPDEAQRGKLKTVRAALKDVKRKELPALDDAWAREMGDFESLEALTKAVRDDANWDNLIARIGKEKLTEIFSGSRLIGMLNWTMLPHMTRVWAKLLDEIIGANEFAVPPSWTSSLVQSYAKAYQIPDEELEKFAGEFRATAERQVRRDLVIETLAQREGLVANADATGSAASSTETGG